MKKNNMKHLCPQDIELCISVLSESFENNKSVASVVKNKNAIPELMRFCVYESMSQNLAFTNEDKTAFALCSNIGVKNTNFKSILRTIRFVIRAVGVFKIPLVLQRESLIHKNHPKKGIHLVFLGVQENEQGKGIGGSFLCELSQFFLLKNQFLYLETSMNENISFYKKHGFSIYNTLDMYGYTLYFFSNAKQ